MKVSNLFFLPFIVAVLFSCSKHKGDIADHIPVATLSILKPADGSVFNVGDSIAIEGVGISTENIHGYDIIVKKAKDTTSYFSVHIHDHNDTLVIDQKWKALVTSGSSLEAVITLVLDHDGHTLTRRAAFSIK